MDEQLAGFMELYGELFVEKLKAALAMNYPYRNGGQANKIVPGAPLGYSTNLYNSITSSYDVNNQELVILMNDYWRYVNDGRKPGKYVPIKPLQLWAMQRLGLDEREAKSAAFGISTNIKKFGIEPTYFYDNAIQALEQQLEGELYEQIGLSIDDFIAQVVEEGIGYNPETAGDQIIQFNL
jgi:hypothetical protein